MAPRANKTATAEPTSLPVAPVPAAELAQIEDFDLEEIEEETRHVVADLRGRPLALEYYANRVTPFTLMKGIEMGKEYGEAGDLLGVVVLLCDVLKSWGLRRGGEPVPVTSEEIQKLPPEVIRAIWTAIRGQAVPNPTTSGPSRGFSAPGA